MFYREEANEFIEIGALNGLFVLGRSIGFVGTLLTSYLVCLEAMSLNCIQFSIVAFFALIS